MSCGLWFCGVMSSDLCWPISMQQRKQQVESHDEKEEKITTIQKEGRTCRLAGGTG